MGQNKAHKQRFGSKHELSEKSKGRQVGQANKSAKAIQRGGSAKERMKQQAEALRKKRAQTAKREKRIGHVFGIPRIVGVLPANESGNTDQVVNGFCKSLMVERPPTNAPFTVFSKEKKCAFTFIQENECNDQDCLDVAKVSDFVVLTLDASQAVQQTIAEITQQHEEAAREDDGQYTMATTWFGDIGLCITDFTRDLISALNSQGAPCVVVVLQGVNTFSEKQRQKVIKVHQRYFLSVLHDSTKVVTLSDDGLTGGDDYASVLRHIQVAKLRQLKWREQRPYLAVEEKHYNAASQELTICGHLRGLPLSANQLVHLTNYGTYQVSTVAVRDAQGETIPYESADPELQESLQQVQANATLGDDGMPTEDDMRFFESETHGVRVPAGVTEEQAVWFDRAENRVDDDEEPAQMVIDENDEGFLDDALTYKTAQTDVDFLRAEDIIRYERMTDEEKLFEMERLREQSEEEAWNPDVVDTPINLPARQRFAKYRGLRSFHHGKWDPAENLPPQYAYIYKLQGYSRVRSNAIESCEEGPTEVGQFVCVTLVNVPEAVGNAADSCLLIASGQLEHEQKWSVLHFQVQRRSEIDEPLKSKTPMLAHIGFRKFYVAPLFSDITSGDRSKFSRFFHQGDNFKMASFYGPISYNPCPILLFQVPSLQEQEEGTPLQLVCFGGALPPNPDTLLLKRAVLNGRVAVIHKKQIVVKYMFFNEEDVRWFQPLDLYTRLGRRGKITKPVGTHGLFKAVFNDQLMQHDVVCMDLYKRVFPKWTTVPFSLCDTEEDGEEKQENEEGYN